MPFGAMWVRPRVHEIPRRRPRAPRHKLAVTMSLKEDALARRRRIEKSVEQMMINPVDPADAAPDSSQLDRLAAAYGTILECIGEDTARSGLQDTPMRAAKAMLAATAGYSQDPREIARDALFPMELEAGGVPAAPLPLENQMVLVRDIKINSLCEHHLLPFFGVAHVAYMPGAAVLGLSKLARIADAIARRLQMQERLTAQLADSLMEVAQARGVSVIVECSHMCMCSRGVKQTDALTLTSMSRGVFATDPSLRAEFHGMLGRPSLAGPSSRL